MGCAFLECGFPKIRIFSFQSLPCVFQTEISFFDVLAIISGMDKGRDRKRDSRDECSIFISSLSVPGPIADLAFACVPDLQFHVHPLSLPVPLKNLNSHPYNRSRPVPLFIPGTVDFKVLFVKGSVVFDVVLERVLVLG